MSEKITNNVPVISFVTRRLVAGYKDEFTNKIAHEIGVKVSPKTGQNKLIRIEGSQEAVQRAAEIIKLLDQKAGVLESQHGLTGTRDVTDDHWSHMAVELKKALKQKFDPLILQRTDTAITLTDSFSKKADGAATAESKQGVQKQKPAKKQSLQFLSGFEPRNLRQALVYEACTETKTNGDGAKSLVNSYVFAAGPFGGGKTFTPIRAGFELYSQGLVDEVIFIRPSTTSSKNNPGAMPGNPRAKIDPYIKGGVGSNVSKIVKSSLQELEAKKIVRVLTPEFERGETYDYAFILVDEPQNLTIEQAELLIGRLGEGSIMVFAGDIGGSQNDIRGQMPGLAHLIATQGSATKTNPILAARTAFVKFTDEDSAARNGILPHVSHALRNPPDAYAEFLKVIQETRQDAKLAEAIDNARKFGEQTLTEIAEKTFNRYEKQIQTKWPSLLPQHQGNVTPFKQPERHHA